MGKTNLYHPSDQKNVRWVLTLLLTFLSIYDVTVGHISPAGEVVQPTFVLTGSLQGESLS